ncbi:MAG: Rieske 2Fe-2S domain-containing protein [Rhodovibrionaceae bacterium]
MLTAEDNELLTRVEGDAPMGQMMRRHWIPACMSEEVEEPGGAPRRVRLLGEDLVAFRGTDGKVAMVGEYCPHRRASLALGRIEDCTLVCLYHGWKIDADGKVLDMPSEPPESKMKDKVKHVAYPVVESGAMIWVYMGPKESMPEFPLPPWMDKPDNSVAIAKLHEAANWAQAMEGTIDSAHSSTLHSSNIRSAANVRGSTDRGGSKELLLERPSVDRCPRIQVQYTSYGFRYAAVRTPMQNADKEDYVRVTVYIAPFISLIPPHDTWQSAQVFVPVDDHNTMFYFVAWSDKKQLDQKDWQKENFAAVGIDVDSYHRKFRNRENLYKQDREAMKNGDFTGIQGVPNQDMAVQESMGSIVDRTKENLGASDVAIVRFRQMMVHAARAFMSGEPAIGTAEPRLPLTEIRAFEGLLPKETPWRDKGVTEQEAAGFRKLTDLRSPEPVRKEA